MLFADIDWSVLKDIVLSIVAGCVALGVPYLGYMTIMVKFREANHEGRIRELERHVKECAELVQTPWPSDDLRGKTFVQRIVEARLLARTNGFPWTMKEVAALAKKYIQEKTAHQPPPKPDDGGFYS